MGQYGGWVAEDMREYPRLIGFFIWFDAFRLWFDFAHHIPSAVEGLTIVKRDEPPWASDPPKAENTSKGYRQYNPLNRDFFMPAV